MTIASILYEEKQNNISIVLSPLSEIDFYYFENEFTF